jgi:hypothetical protein
VEVDVGKVFIGEEVEGLDGAVGGEVLGWKGGSKRECSEEGGDGEFVEVHVVYKQCKPRR